MTTSNTLIAEQIKRVNQSIVETEKVIAKQKLNIFIFIDFKVQNHPFYIQSFHTYPLYVL